MAVKVWRESVMIPTYECGAYEKNPIFLEKRVYQGSSGVVYPYPVIEKIADEKTDHWYKAVYMENEYLKVMILPELGGRVQMAYDKVKQRHFVYYNHVVKPALVGLAGPWISGGIEFNWPQHHRPSTYMPVDSDIEAHADGSMTVWVNEQERMFHQKGSAGFTLRPGCAYLEIEGVVYNRTDLPQTFLWWANPAVEVNDAYQSVFPQDVNAVFDHGKRAVSTFPVATGTYYKMDYSAGVDISNYKNIKVPTSYMAVNSKFDFEGGYENDTHGGMLHVASHHQSPGKKQWTWGNGDFGRAWDRNLTDADETGRFRPYIELMAGVYTENQPDFTWLMPYEEKRFTQYFMPYRELGVVKQASKDLIMNIEEVRGERSEVRGQFVRLQLLATSRQEVRIILHDDNGTEYYNNVETLTPEDVFSAVIDVKEATLNHLNVSILSPLTSHLSPLLTWHAEPDEVRPVPDAAEAALPPADTKTNDQLYLTGLHLEQYRHATWSALDYYEEALRRDPRDVRCLNQMGLWYLRRGRFEKAEEYLRRAVGVWQKRNPNPYDGEPIYNLALALKYQRKYDEAYELFWKATWNKAWADAGYFEAAKISALQGRYADALDEADRSLQNNWHNHRARALKAAVLRHLDPDDRLHDERAAFIAESLRLDRFNFGVLEEQCLLEHDDKLLAQLKTLMRKSADNYLDLALEYSEMGDGVVAEGVLCDACYEGIRHPMVYYYLGQVGPNVKDGPMPGGSLAEDVSPDCCFPNRLQDIGVLQWATDMGGVRAPYYLGCLYYDKRQYDLAISCWETATSRDPLFPTAWRCLALARFNKQNRPGEAVELMERAYSLDETDSRVLMELDQLYKVLQRPHAERLALLQAHPAEVAQRDDLILEEITLLNQLGRYDEAMQRLDAHQFHPWEGGEGKVPMQYQTCRVELAKEKLKSGRIEELKEAVALLEQCLAYPHHLGEGKLQGAQENDFYYLMGCAYEQMLKIEDGKLKMENGCEAKNLQSSIFNLQSKARECWLKATEGPMEPAAAMYYNDAKPDKIFYAGMAWRKLGEDAKANGVFHRLVAYGEKHLFDRVTMDYFAVSLPDLLIWDGDLQQANTVHCKYMMALGHYGLGHREKCGRYLREAEALNVNHQGIQAFRTLLAIG